MEWAIEECLKTSLPVGASMCIGPEGDMHGVSAAECAIRMARAGAHIGQWNIVVSVVRWFGWYISVVFRFCTFCSLQKCFIFSRH